MIKLGFEIRVQKPKETDFEAVGIAGEFNLRTGKIEPQFIYIGTIEEVQRWLNKFGGLDIIEFVIYDKYAQALKKIRELEKIIEELRLQLAKR